MFVACQCGQQFLAERRLGGQCVACPACGSVARSAGRGNAAAIVECGCGQRFQAAPHLFGQTVGCPSCGGPLYVSAPYAEPISATAANPSNQDGFWDDAIPKPQTPVVAAGPSVQQHQAAKLLDSARREVKRQRRSSGSGFSLSD